MAFTREFFKCLLIFLICLSKIAKTHKRSRLDLKFPQGTSLSVGVALLSLYPKGPLSEGFLQFLEFDLVYPMSEEIVFTEMVSQKRNDLAPGKWTNTKKKYYDKKNYKKFKSAKRHSIEYEKKKLLFKIQNAMIKLGYNGPACTSRLQCELKYISPNNSLVEELIVELFKPPFNIPQKDCETFILNCPISLLHIMLHSEHIFSI